MAKDKKEDAIRYSRISPNTPGNYTALSHDYVGGNQDITSSRPKRLIDYMAHDREGNSLVYAQVMQSEGGTHTYMNGLERVLRQRPNHQVAPRHDNPINNPPGRPGAMSTHEVHLERHPIVDLERTDVKPNSVSDKDSYYDDRTNTRPAKPGEQLVMFGIDHTPTARILHSLYARDSTAGKLATMNILGIADNASRDSLGHGLLPDNNLSEHSLSLVKKLHKKGAIPAEDLPDELIQSNDMDFSDAARVLDTQHRSMFDDGQLIDLSHRLPHAKARIRKALGRSAPNLNTEPKAEQLQLEGFE